MAALAVPGASHAIQWAVSAVGWAKELFKIFQKITEKITYYEGVYLKDKTRAILIRESFESLTENNRNAKALFQDVIDEHNAKTKKANP